MIGFSETKNTKILSGTFKQIDLQNHVRRLFDSEKFMNSIRQATSDELSVKNRIEGFIQHLNAF
jgi:hypothetical protein